MTLNEALRQIEWVGGRMLRSNEAQIGVDDGPARAVFSGVGVGATVDGG